MGEKSLLRERIQFLFSTKNVSIYSICNDKSHRNTITRQINQGTAISADTIELILTKFPDVSAEWLLRGEGTMSKADHLAPHIYANGGSVVQNGHHQGDVTIDTPSQYELYGKDAIITAKDDQIAMLRDQVLHLQQDKQQLHLLLNALTQPTCSKH